MSKNKDVQIEKRFRYVKRMHHSYSKIVLHLKIGPEMSENLKIDISVTPKS